MARQAQGHRVYAKRGWFYVYFTHAKRPYHLALGTKDPVEASVRAAKEYADVVAGRVAARVGARSLLTLEELLAQWLDESTGVLDIKTLETYEIYAKKFVRFFRTLDGISEATVGTYTRRRLTEVLAGTVRKERSGLSSFLKWAKEQEAIHQVPPFPDLPPKATGTRSGAQRAEPVDVTPEEARAIIAKLPRESKTIDGRKWPVRARFEFAWETGLRPKTLATLSVPEHWRRGRKTLHIAAENDKSRFGRDVPLTPRAREILAEVAPARGTVFGRHNFDKALKKAAKAILGRVRGEAFAAYDFRHGRATEVVERSGSLPGAAYLLGHRRVTTTNRYVRGSLRSAAAALDSLTILSPGRKKPG